jgi:hypothetical protein
METTRSSMIENVRQVQRSLMEDLSRLDEAVHEGFERNLPALRSLLGATYTQVCEHFRLEEKDGFLDNLEEREPRFARIAQELIDEHRELRQSLDALHGDAIVATRVDDALRERVRKWIAEVRRHETRENDLIQDAVDSDVAAED